LKTNWNVILPILTLLVGVVTGLAAPAITGALNTDAQIKGKAADIIFAGDPTGTERFGRIALLAQLYPGQLSAFAKAGPGPTDDPYLWQTSEQKRLAFYQQAMTKVQCVDQIIDLWRQLFGPNRVGDTGKTEWIETMKVSSCPSDAIPSASASSAP
jgi:hypothetical protein